MVSLEFREWEYKVELTTNSSERTKLIIERYPWARVEDSDEYTWIDSLPEGWYKAFGLEMFEEINEALKKYPQGARDDFKILDIKEKFGTLRFYTNWSTKEINQIKKTYEELSAVTCIDCGRPATRFSTSWIAPFCTWCAPEDSTPINKHLLNSIKEV